MAAASGRHVARLLFQSASVLIDALMFVKGRMRFGAAVLSCGMVF
jgi:hypothetical protein